MNHSSGLVRFARTSMFAAAALVLGALPAQATSTHVYWTDATNGTLERAELDGSSPELLFSGLSDPRGVVVDNDAGLVYWAENGTGSIYSANVDGTGEVELVSGLNTPKGLTLDASAGKLYWADHNDHTICRANVDGSGMEVVIDSGSIGGVFPTDVAVDPAAGKVYWTMLGPGQIQRANLDGSGIELVLTSSRPEGIDLDPDAGNIYFTDFTDREVKRSGLDGSGVTTLISMLDSDLLSGISVDLDGGKLYFGADSTVGDDAVYRANLDGSGLEAVNNDAALSKPQWVSVGSAEGGPPDGDPGDPGEARVFWTDSFSSKIQSANGDGTDEQDVLTGLSDPKGIAVNQIDGIIYWTEAGTGTIHRAATDGSSPTEIVSGLNNPKGITVDQGAGKLYWADHGDHQIYRSNISGASVEVVVDSGSLGGLFPTDVAVDPIGGKVYWTMLGPGQIQRANLDGSGVETVLTSSRPEGIDLDVLAGHIYFTDFTERSVKRANLDGSGVTTLVSFLDSDLTKGIAVDTENDQLYFVIDSTVEDDAIARTNLDGSGLVHVADAGLTTPQFVAVGPPVVALPPLVLEGVTPGLAGADNTITVTGGTPGERTIILAGKVFGTQPIPSCPGLAADIGLPRVLGSLPSDASGTVELTRFFPFSISGTLLFQAVEPSSCRVSNLVTVPLP